ncbi:FHA domain-containing protein [Labedella gwakjiensis]|uniref:FHA domain-containing protein n=1 Tax=Labedella gwakjiensis TaxID=390269 RepID=A0A2P8GS35_9MICO|nr:FHA domain-containing protein [Labedella gwakjiensis]PSL36771.1 FHA domain-containing protein [Labedella gwakjiensis]RUQ84284.1 FHA domain-containing protein [Labedella gwakjiensis]
MSSPGFRYSLETPAPSWLYLVGAETVVGMLTPVDQPVVDAVWRVVSRPDTRFDDVISVIPETLADGRLLSFVALAVRPDTQDTATVSALVHGDGMLDVDVVGGSARIAPPADRAWARSELSGVIAVSSITRGGAGIGASVEFPVAGGIIVADRIAWGARRMLPEQHGVDPDRLVRAADLTGEVDRTVRRDDLPTASASASAAVSDPATSPPGSGDPADAPVGPIATGSVPVAADDIPDSILHDGRTVLRSSLRTGQVRSADGVDPGTPDSAPPAPRRPPTFAFRVRDGQPYPLDVVHYVGRNPKQPRIPLNEPVRLFSVASPTKLVSSTHLELRQQGDSVVVTDLRSTNGTSVILPGRDWQRLRGGQGIAVIPGTFVDIGDGVVLEILPPSLSEQGSR